MIKIGCDMRDLLYAQIRHLEIQNFQLEIIEYQKLHNKREWHNGKLSFQGWPDNFNSFVISGKHLLLLPKNRLQSSSKKKLLDNFSLAWQVFSKCLLLKSQKKAFQKLTFQQLN